jgi:hypothetical protein
MMVSATGMNSTVAQILPKGASRQVSRLFAG